MNIWKKSRKLSGNTIAEVAVKTGIPEEKLKEIERGERSMPKERVDAYLDVVKSTNKAEVALERAKAKEWFRTANLRELRKEFKYSLVELESKIGISSSGISRMERDRSLVRLDYIMKFYYFYTDELNKNLDNKRKAYTICKPFKNSKRGNQLFDIRKYIKNLDITKEDLMMELNIPKSTLNSWENQTYPNVSYRLLLKKFASDRGLEIDIYNGEYIIDKSNHIDNINTAKEEEALLVEEAIRPMESTMEFKEGRESTEEVLRRQNKLLEDALRAMSILVNERANK